MLYAKHLGLRGSYWKLKEAGDARLAELEAVVDEGQGGRLDPGARDVPLLRGVFGGQCVHVLDGGREAAVFHFPRQAAGERLCLADFVAPRGAAPPDTIALFITTAGEGVRARAEELKDRRASTCSATAFRRSPSRRPRPPPSGCTGSCAPAGASPIRRDLTMTDLFQSRYRASATASAIRPAPSSPTRRRSFGSSTAGKIGVELTEGFMMDPEASVSAVVVHHPQARYFAV